LLYIYYLHFKQKANIQNLSELRRFRESIVLFLKISYMLYIYIYIQHLNKIYLRLKDIDNFYNYFRLIFFWETFFINIYSVITNFIILILISFYWNFSDSNCACNLILSPKKLLVKCTDKSVQSVNECNWIIIFFLV